MQKDELYPELADYIYEYCRKHFTKHELLANHNFISLPKTDYGKKTQIYDILHRKGLVSTDKEVLQLMEEGLQAFKKKVTTRIYTEHWDELELNCCPQCGKIARTPSAKQCRFCFYKWHDKNDDKSF